MDLKRYNSTTLFLLPFLPVKKEDIINDNFKGAYLKGSCIQLVYKVSNTTLQKYSPLIEEEGYAMYRFPIRSRILSKFLEGSYSKLLPIDKQAILKFWKETKYGKFYRLLYPPKYPTGILTSEELWPKPNLKNETLNLGSL